MKTFLQKALVSILLLVPAFSAMNCVYYYRGEEMRVNNFMGNLLSFDALSRFIYTTENYNVEENSPVTSYAENIDQWFKYCNDPSVKKTDIYRFLYETDNEMFIKHQKIFEHNNSFIRTIKNNKEAYEYLKLINAKDKESFTNTWDNFAKNEQYGYYYNHANVNPNTCDSLYHRCTDPFLKKRYAYQYLICSFYGQDSAKVHALFKKHFANSQKDWLDYSAQHYYAYLHPKHDSLRLDCIMHGSDKFFVNVQLLNTSPNFKKWINKEKDPETLSYLLAVQSLRNPGRNIDALQKIVTLYPSNRLLNFLITREINKIEDWIQTPKITGFDSFVHDSWYDEANYDKKNNWFADYAYSKRFLMFLNTIPVQKDNELCVRLANTYLRLILNIPNSPVHNLNAKDFVSDSKFYVQARVLEIFMKLNAKSLAPTIEQEILETIRLSEKSSDPYYMYQFIRTASQLMLQHQQLRGKAYMLLAQGGLPKAVGDIYSSYSFYIDLFKNASVADIDQVMEVIRKKERIPFEEYIATLPANVYYYYYDEYDEPKHGQIRENYDTLKILDTKAIKHIHKDELEEALAVYKTFPKTYWDTYYYDDPFTFSIYDGHNHGHTDKAGYTKKDFLEKLIAYKKQLKTNPSDALLNYYIGNAYLSLTYYGKNWYMYDNYWTSGDDGRVASKNTFEQSYYACAQAIPYYKAALLCKADDKLHKLVAINLAYCLERAKNRPMSKFLSKEQNEFYQEIQGNCDLYAQYLDAYRHVGSDYVKGEEQSVRLRKFEYWY
jgi:hypothetical protein